LARRKNWRLGLVCILVVFLVGALLAGCGGTPQPAGEESKAPIKIGVSTPLSPPADYKAGEINLNTVRLAVKHINDAGGVLGRTVEIVEGDDQGDTAAGVSLVQKMVNEDKVSAIVGVWHGSVALAQATAATELEVPIMMHYSWPDEITAMHSDYVFRTSPYNSQIALLLMPFIKSQGYKTVAVMAEDSAYGIGFADGMVAAAEGSGVEVIKRVFPAQSVDLTPQLLELKAMSPKPDLLIVAAVYQPMYLIPKQAVEVGLAPECHVMAGWDYPGWSPEWWETVGEAGIGVMYPTFQSKELALTSLGETFKAAFVDAYGYEPPIYAYFLYDEVMMLAEAMEAAGTDDPKAVAAALKNITFEGTTGTVTFESVDEPGSPIWNQWLGHQIFIIQFTAEGQTQDEASIAYKSK